jgi:hypothetical protein
MIYRHYRDLAASLETLQSELGQLQAERDRLVGEFDANLGKLRLPMRLRRRSGGLLAWRNIAVHGSRQRDKDLADYPELPGLPQQIQNRLMRFEKQRLLINLNLSVTLMEIKQVSLTQKKFAVNTSLLQSSAA